MNDREKSDSSVVPEKSPNKPDAAVEGAEAMEGRGLAKGNPSEHDSHRTQRRVSVSSGLDRVREAARRDRSERFTALMHHIYDVGRLREAYQGLSRDAAAGVDGVTWRAYGEALEDNLQEWPIPKMGRYLAAVVRGHVAYFGVPTNSHAIGAFRLALGWIWKRALERRSERTRVSWERMSRLIERWLPLAGISHPYPAERFDAKTRGRSRMR